MDDLGGVVDVLDGVEGLRLFENGRAGYALGGGKLGHGVGFNELIVSGSSSHDDARGYTSLVLVNTFKNSFALLGRWSAVVF